MGFNWLTFKAILNEKMEDDNVDVFEEMTLEDLMNLVKEAQN